MVTFKTGGMAVLLVAVTGLCSGEWFLVSLAALAIILLLLISSLFSDIQPTENLRLDLPRPKATKDDAMLLLGMALFSLTSLAIAITSREIIVVYAWLGFVGPLGLCFLFTRSGVRSRPS